MFPYITHPSATRYITITVQLACFRPAASVRSEPGSNSHLYLFQEPSQRIFSKLLILLTYLSREPYKNFTIASSLPLLRLHSSMHLNSPVFPKTTAARASISSTIHSILLQIPARFSFDFHFIIFAFAFLVRGIISN